MAERMRFELTVAFTTPPFQDGALNRSANAPIVKNIIQNGFTLSSLGMVHKLF